MLLGCLGSLVLCQLAVQAIATKCYNAVSFPSVAACTAVLHCIACCALVVLLTRMMPEQAQAEEELSTAEDQIRRLKTAKQQADVANAFAEARAAKLADELAEAQAARGGSAGAQHDQHLKDIAVVEETAGECQRLQEQVLPYVLFLLPSLCLPLQHAHCVPVAQQGRICDISQFTNSTVRLAPETYGAWHGGRGYTASCTCHAWARMNETWSDVHSRKFK